MLLLRPAPRFDGPYDDEPAERPRHVVDGNLALAFPRSTTAAVPLRLVPPAGGVDGEEAALTVEPIPDPRRLVGAIAQAVAEVLLGARARQQLSEVATLEVLALLERNGGRLAPRDAGRLAPRDGGRLAPGGGRLAPRPRVTSIRLCEPRRGVAEVAAVIDTGARRRAMALRLQAVQGRWRCTVVRVG